jgi:hypothetical protein
MKRRLPVFSALGMTVVLGIASPATPLRAQSCADDYTTVETIRGVIMDIKPAPDPFKTADIFFSGPAPCTHIWMQVLKTDAAKCHVGDAIAVKGVFASDVDANSWEVGPTKNEYMTLGDDFTCG